MLNQDDTYTINTNETAINNIRITLFSVIIIKSYGLNVPADSNSSFVISIGIDTFQAIGSTPKAVPTLFISPDIVHRRQIGRQIVMSDRLKSMFFIKIIKINHYSRFC